MTEYCPYCGKPVVRISSVKIYGRNFGKMKACSDYPKCDSYSGLGATIANKELRSLRKRCHLQFDKRWKTAKQRGRAYRWLQEAMLLSPQEAHISKFRDEQCQQLLSILSDELFSKLTNK